MTDREPVAEVLGVLRTGDVTRTRLRIVGGVFPRDPIAPAGLYSKRRPEQEVMQLHKLVNREPGEVLVFESYGIVSTPPESGDQVILRPWWTPDAWNAATDPQRNWQRRIYDESDHDHCLLTWQTISVGEEAYRSELGEWVSADAYERFIRDDVLRLRDAG